MSETMVTFGGWLGSSVSLRRVGEVPVANFRVASTPRRFQRSTGTWVDGEPQWYAVAAWRGLGEHCARSLRRGDPVLVHGKLVHRTYTDGEGVSRTSLDVEAAFVGHDLRWGVTTFSKLGQPDAPTEEAAAVQEPAA